MNVLRWSLTCAVVAAFAAAVWAHEEPVVLLVGLFPVAWIAVELVWRTFASPSHRPQADTRDALKRTGMRRGPNGFANF